jgi:multidrug efflux system membrane fusion protein
MTQAERPNPPPPVNSAVRSNRRWLWGALVVIALLALLALIWKRHHDAGAQDGSPRMGGRAGRGGASGAAANAPQTVRLAPVTQGDMPVQLNALGTVTPLATVTVRTQIAGQLLNVGFQEGQLVHKGDFLAQIDPRPYEISLLQAQGTLAHDQGLLEQARADLARYEVLLKQDSISAQQVDDQRYLVKQYQGQVAADQAQVKTFQLDLTYCHIVAPVDGRVGLRQVDPGNYAQTSDTNGIVIITKLTPISVIFTIPEDNVPAVQARLNSGAQLQVSAYDRSSSTLLAQGVLATTDNQIDTTTGTLKLRANFANPTLSLFPNQFVNARLLVNVEHGATIVPSAAVQTGSIGQYVYVAQPDNTVTVRPVKPGVVDGERTSILSGLAPGEQVVIDGVDRLREGARIALPQPVSSKPASGAHLHGGSGAHAWGASGASGAHAHHHKQDDAA